MTNPVPIPQRLMLLAIACGIPLSGIGALYSENTWLQGGPVALALPLLVAGLRRWPLSHAALACITAFLLVHLIGARWSYSFVPYREWLMLGEGGDARNQFDRLVHLLFGMLAMLPFAEIATRHGRLSLRIAMAGAMLFVLAIGGLYEIFEWGLTFTLAPEQAGAYNGEQGDRFDSQKDMALAALGALIAAPLVWWRLRSS